MNTELKGIYSEILRGCVDASEMGLIVDSKTFKYTNVLDDIRVEVDGIIYGDEITFQRGKITKIDVSSNKFTFGEEDVKEFKDRLSDDFWKIANTIA